MKYKLFLISYLLIMPIVAYSQTVTLKVTGEGEPLIGAHVYANGRIATATNANGIATVKANAGDKLKISYIGYNDENVALTQKIISKGSIAVDMKPKVFNIDEAKVTRSKDDMHILKAKLKKGLKMRVSPDSISFTQIDTLLNVNDNGCCFTLNGNAVFKRTGMQPIINISSIKLDAAFKNTIVDTMRLENSDTVKKNYTNLIASKIGNSMAAALHIYKFKKMKVFYRGNEHNKDIFYFSYTIAKDNNYKINGLVYLNEFGIIERITHSGITSTSKFTTYHMDTSFEYFSKDNTILPKSYLRKSYKFNSNMEIKENDYETLELFHNEKNN